MSRGAHWLQLVEVVALQRVLILRVALPAADAEVLRRPAGTGGARDRARTCGRSRAIT